MANALKPAAIEARLAELNASAAAPWIVQEGKLARTYEFADFVAAFTFMTAVALVAERMNHHPEWFNVYRTVRVALTTHDAGGITELDFELALSMERLAGGVKHS